MVSPLKIFVHYTKISNLPEMMRPTTPRQPQSGRNVFDIIPRELTNPIPVPAPREGQGAWREGWGVYSGKIGDCERIFDFAIVLTIPLKNKKTIAGWSQGEIGWLASYETS